MRSSCAFLIRLVVKLLLFFFSSRRRHTRWNCDWSSGALPIYLILDPAVEHIQLSVLSGQSFHPATRSEERRVGKQCRSRWSPHDGKKKEIQGRCMRESKIYTSPSTR